MDLGKICLTSLECVVNSIGCSFTNRCSASFTSVHFTYHGLLCYCVHCRGEHMALLLPVSLPCCLSVASCAIKPRPSYCPCPCPCFLKDAEPLGRSPSSLALLWLSSTLSPFILMHAATWAVPKLELATARRLPVHNHLPYSLCLALLGVPCMLVGLHRAGRHYVPCHRDVRVWPCRHTSPRGTCTRSTTSGTDSRPRLPLRPSLLCHAVLHFADAGAMLCLLYLPHVEPPGCLGQR